MQHQRATLDIDNRETLVLAHKEELSAIHWEQKQLTIGDYIVREGPNIIAVIERKSLEDYAASIKDGRASNKDKMCALRAKTGCRVMYIIECPSAIPVDDSKKYGRIPFGCIRSSIYHLMLRDNIMIMWSSGTIGTARELVKFVRSTNTLLDSIGDSSFLSSENNAPVEVAPIDLSELTARQERSDHEIVRGMWSLFRGITTESADDYMKTWSIADIVLGRVPRTVLAAHKLSNRRVVSRTTVDSLCSIGPILETKLLSQVPQISTKSAGDILRGRDLPTVLRAPVEIIAGYVTGKRDSRLGDIRAARLVALFNYKYGGEGVAAPVDGGHRLGGAVVLDDPDLDLYEDRDAPACAVPRIRARALPNVVHK